MRDSFFIYMVECLTQKVQIQPSLPWRHHHRDFCVKQIEDVESAPLAAHLVNDSASDLVVPFTIAFVSSLSEVMEAADGAGDISTKALGDAWECLLEGSVGA